MKRISTGEEIDISAAKLKFRGIIEALRDASKDIPKEVIVEKFSIVTELLKGHDIELGIDEFSQIFLEDEKKVEKQKGVGE